MNITKELYSLLLMIYSLWRDMLVKADDIRLTAMIYNCFRNGYFLVQVTGEERKTVDNCFSRTKSTKQREIKQGYTLREFRLCDLTGEPTRISSLEIDGNATSVKDL